MKELEVFEKNFESWRLMWLQGPDGANKVRITYEFLRLCKVSETRVMKITAHQFVDIMKKGLPKTYSSFYDVLIIQSFDSLRPKALLSFLRALMSYNDFKKSFGLRIVLVSKENFLGTPLFTKELNPFIIRVKNAENDPGDLNERIHALIEQASLKVNKRITQISEQVACVFELMACSKGDDELLAFLVASMRGMEGTILQYHHLFPKRVPKTENQPKNTSR